MAKMLDNPDVTEKVELYKLRDEILKKIKSEGESKDEDKDSNDKGKDKGRKKVAKDEKKGDDFDPNNDFSTPARPDSPEGARDPSTRTSNLRYDAEQSKAHLPGE